MRKAVVFGGTGWVGHYVALDLKAHGYEVVVASRGKKIEDYEVGLGDIPRVVLDKSNAAEMQAFFQDNKFDTVIDMVPTPESIASINSTERFIAPQC